MSEFDKYIIHGEPGQKEKADAWQTAIGLQDVDGLKLICVALLRIRTSISNFTSAQFFLVVGDTAKIEANNEDLRDRIALHF